MTVIIEMPDGTSEWDVSNWYYRKFVEDVIAKEPDNEQLQFTMERGSAYGMLFLTKLESDALEKTLRLMRQVAEEIVARKLPGFGIDIPGEVPFADNYRKSMAWLLEIMNAKSLGLN